jgi:hypothetical protein
MVEMSFATTALAIELIGFFARRGDDILIGAFLGATVLGFFNVAYRILTIVMDLFTSTINAVAFPAGIWLINRATLLHPATYLRQSRFPVGASLVMAAVMVPLRSVLVGEAQRPASPRGQAAGPANVGGGRSPSQPDVSPRSESNSNGVT